MNPSSQRPLLNYSLLFLIINFFLCPSVFSSAPSGDKYGGELILATTSDPKSFNDIVASETSTSAITSKIFEGLTTVDPFTLKTLPLLAERWDHNEDGLIWTFYLRKDVTWFDGVPFTADDVVFTFNDLIYNPDIPNPAKDIFTIDERVFKVEKIDTFTVRFTLPVKFAPFLKGMGQSILPKHKLEKAVQEKKFVFTWGIDTPTQEIVGTGPFRLKEYRPGERIILQKNPTYWKFSDEGERLPYLEKIIYLIVQNQDASILKFIDGELDSISLRGSDFPLVKPLEKKKNFTVYDAGPDFGSNFITFNQNPRLNPKNGKPFVDPIKLSWFSNIHFRQAVAHAIDKNKIIEIIENGLGYPQYSQMSPSAGFFYNPNVVKYDYDLTKAKQILTDAGFIDRNGNGILEDPQGHEIEFNLFTNSGAVERVQIASIIRNDLQKLGMKVNFNAIEFNVLVAKLTSSWDWEAIILGLTGGVEPHFGKNVWDSKGGLHMWSPKQEAPQTEWETRVNEIFSAGAQELDEDKRKVLYDEFQVIVSKELPLVYTVLGSDLYAIRNKFGNLKPSSVSGAWHNLESIYILKEYR